MKPMLGQDEATQPTSSGGRRWPVGDQRWVERVRGQVTSSGGPRWLAFSSAARHDLWDAGGWLVVGAAAAATLQVLVPRSLLLAVAGHPTLSVLALGGLTVGLASVQKPTPSWPPACASSPWRPGWCSCAMTEEQTRSLLLVVVGATAIWLWGSRPGAQLRPARARPLAVGPGG